LTIVRARDAPSIAAPPIASLKRKGNAQNEEAPPKKKIRGTDAIAAHMILHPGARKFQPWTSGHKKYNKELKYNKAIEDLNIRRDGQTTVTKEEKAKVAELEADPRVLWYTFVSVKCAGCDSVLCGDTRRAFYITLWEKHTKTCKPARAILRRQLELASSISASIPSLEKHLAF
jgi:translation initiation factor 2 beta subunit (eIF-2beta)/eIF-5